MLSRVIGALPFGQLLNKLLFDTLLQSFLVLAVIDLCDACQETLNAVVTQR